MKPSPSPPNCSKDYWKLLLLLIFINWPSLVTSWVVILKIYSKLYLVWWTNTHLDITDSVNHEMVQNTKTWITWEQNKIFLWNQKIINLWLRWHILRSYHFVAEVTFKLQISWLFRIRSFLTFRQLQSVVTLWNVYVTWQEHAVKCTVQISF